MESVVHTRILGLDFGEKRIGVAISDPLQITAQPLQTIQYRAHEKLWMALDRIINVYKIEKIVIGQPINMNGSLGKSYHKVELFAEKVKVRYQLEVEFGDERLTSTTAEKTLRSLGKRPTKNKKEVDKLAAILILQGYLDKRKAKINNEP